MMKYIIAFVMLASLLVAQELDLSTLDKPYKEQSHVDARFSVKVTGALFNGFSINSILDKLLHPEKLTGHPSFTGYYTDATYAQQAEKAALVAELAQYQSMFPSAMEPLTNGTVAYYDWYGTNLNPADSAAKTELDKELKGTKNDYVYSNLYIYAGRNTAADDGSYSDAVNGGSSYSELELVTNNGTKYTIFAYDCTTPLVLDMDGDQKLEASNGEWLPHATNISTTQWVDFDINGDGFEEAVEWVGANDGLLVSNYNPTTKATGACLFGSATGYANGFEMLATLDANHDSKINGEELNTLSVWQDKNRNASMDIGEVTSVQELGITELGTNHNNMVSYYVRDGKNYLVWDWYPTMLMTKKMQK